jgi:hypothetical protein
LPKWIGDGEVVDAVADSGSAEEGRRAARAELVDAAEEPMTAAAAI